MLKFQIQTLKVHFTVMHIYYIFIEPLFKFTLAFRFMLGLLYSSITWEQKCYIHSIKTGDTIVY